MLFESVVLKLSCVEISRAPRETDSKHHPTARRESNANFASRLRGPILRRYPAGETPIRETGACRRQEMSDARYRPALPARGVRLLWLRARLAAIAWRLRTAARPSLRSVAQSSSAWNTGPSAVPASVMVYSTFGGIC